jgi:hypothetical protein
MKAGIMFRSLLVATAMFGLGAGDARAALTNMTTEACPSWSMAYSPATGMNWSVTLTNPRAAQTNPHGPGTLGTLTITPTTAGQIDVSIFPTAGQPLQLTIVLRGQINIPPLVLDEIKARTPLRVSLSIDNIGTTTQTLHSLSFHPQPGSAPCP